MVSPEVLFLLFFSNNPLLQVIKDKELHAQIEGAAEFRFFTSLFH